MWLIQNGNPNMKKRIIFVDIDETICKHPDSDHNSQVGNRNYKNAIPIQENIDKINKLYDNGDKIIYWTARGSRSGIDWFKLTKQQLVNWGAKHHELRCDKPFYDFFVEDRSVRIEEI